MNATPVPGYLQDAAGARRPVTELSRDELCLAFDLLARAVTLAEDVEVLRPGEVPFSLDEIRGFRRELYRKRSPHLLSPEQEAIERELEIDRKGLHFVALRDGKMAGALRVKAWPFEASQLSPELARAAEPFREYGEISRFVVHPGAQGKYVGEKLFWGCLRWLCRQTEFRGILWICRPEVLPYFLRYGLDPARVLTVRLEGGRSGDYHLVGLSFATVLDTVLTHLRENPEELVKRKRKGTPSPCAS